jgi:outer membrane protein TolC
MLEQDFIRLKFMKETLDLSYENYQIQRKDNNLGLVNTLEVLQALTTYIEAKKTYDTMKLEVDRNYLLLQVKTGMRI